MSLHEPKPDHRDHSREGDKDQKPAAKVYYWRRRTDREMGPKGIRTQPGRGLSEEIERLNHLRLQHIHMLTGALSSCVMFRRNDLVEPLSWLDTPPDQRLALAAALRCGRLPIGWESVSEREGDLEVVLCLRGAAREGLKAMKSYLIHWFAAQKFSPRG